MSARRDYVALLETRRKRNARIYELKAAGLLHKQIAYKMGLTLSTVKNACRLLIKYDSTKDEWLRIILRHCVDNDGVGPYEETFRFDGRGIAHEIIDTRRATAQAL